MSCRAVGRGCVLTVGGVLAVACRLRGLNILTDGDIVVFLQHEKTNYQIRQIIG